MDRSLEDARERARSAAARAHGWLSDAQGEALFEAAARPRGDGVIVEIGSWQGRSTIWLASGARLSGRTVLAIDPHEGSREDPSARTFERFRENLSAAGLLDAVTPLVMRSAEAAARMHAPVDLLFVDGDHSPEGARSDAEIWLPRVAIGGIVLFHDVATSGYAGPRRAFQRRVCWNRDFHRVRKVGSMGVAERTAAPGWRGALQGAAFGALLFRYDIQGALKRALRSARRFFTHGPRVVTGSL